MGACCTAKGPLEDDSWPAGESLRRVAPALRVALRGLGRRTGQKRRPSKSRVQPLPEEAGPEPGGGVDFGDILLDVGLDLDGPCSADEAEEAERLVGRGLTLRQLLDFYAEHLRSGELCKDTTTEEIIREIVLPQTVGRPGCYMESEFMRARGGPRRARKLVSHAWSSPFLGTLLGILEDAKGTELSGPPVAQSYLRDGELSLEAVLGGPAAVPAEALQETYWLCSFAVNLHGSLCGDCFGCRGSAAWTPGQFAASVCELCGERKRNPCPCGTPKPCWGDPGCEVDKLARLLLLVDGLVVCLDAELRTLESIWVVSEVGEALRRGRPVWLRMPHRMGEGPRRLLAQGGALPPAISACRASRQQDKAHLLAELAAGGWQAALEECLLCLVDLSFGRSSRLAALSSPAARALGSLSELRMDFRWCQDLYHMMNGLKAIFT